MIVLKWRSEGVDFFHRRAQAASEEPGGAVYTVKRSSANY